MITRTPPLHPENQPFSVKSRWLKCFPMSERTSLILVILAIALFITLPLYKTLRQPRIGDQDNVRIGLMVLNRYASDYFPRDIAMQAGAWWPGYTPWYLFMIGMGFRVFGDLGIGFAALTAINYLSLMTGFFFLGKRLGLPTIIALILAYLSGLYQVTGHGLAWAGVGNEMALPRNIYLALFPWIVLMTLRLYEGHSKTRVWLLFGAALGLSTIIHSISGGFLLTILTLMMFIGVLLRRFEWQHMLVFVIAAIPGAIIGYSAIDASFEAVEASANTAQRAFVYFSIARANIFFYRLPDWPVAIAVYTLLTLVGVVILLRSYRSKGLISPTIWQFLGIVQFSALLLTLVADWWTLFVAVEWLRRAHAGKLSPYERLAMLFVGTINFATLAISAGVSAAGLQLASSPLIGIARLFQRGQALGYAGLILFTCFILWDYVHTYPARLLFIATAAATLITGMHMAEFETIPGPWLLFDVWTYLGVIVLLLWHQLNQSFWRDVRNAGTVIVIFQAVSRLMAYPAPITLTVLIGVVVFTASLLYRALGLQKQVRYGIIGAGALATIAIIILPISGTSFLKDTIVRTKQVILRDWSRLDTQQLDSIYYPVGEWLRENTPVDSLVLTYRTDLRYWSLRSQTTGVGDPKFLRNYPDAYKESQRQAIETKEAYKSKENLLAYAEKVGADYILLNHGKVKQINLTEAEAVVAFEDAHFTLYYLKP